MLKEDKLIKIIKNHSADVLGNPRKAAVLLLLTMIEGEWHIIFEERGKTIRQPGETSFPGGGIEIGESKEEAVIRETYEELGIEPKHIEIIGEIDYSASENHVVYCFVGILKNINIEQFQLDPNEVSSVYTVPLNYFLDHEPEYFDMPLKADRNANFPFHLINNGVKYPFYVLKRKVLFYRLPKGLEKYTLWGFTASFVNNFIDILKSGIELDLNKE